MAPKKASAQEAAELDKLAGPVHTTASDAESVELDKLAGLEPQHAPAQEPSLKDRFLNFMKREGGAAADTFMGDTKAAGDTASFGLLPRALAAKDALGETLNGHGGLVKNYNDALTARQADSRETAYQHPSAAIVGSFLTPPVGKGLSLAQRLTAAGVTGSAAGVLQAPHNDSAAQLRGGVAGGLGGLAVQGGSELLAPAANAVSNSLRKWSGGLAANVAGGGKGQIGDRLKSIGIDPLEQSDFGNQLLDEGLIPSGLHPTESPVEGVLKRSRASMAQQGHAINDELSAADSKSYFEPGPAQQEMQGNINARNPLELDNAKKASNLVDQVGQLDSRGTFAEANRMKSQAWGAANFKDDAPLEASQYRKAVAGFRNGIRDQVGAANGPESADRLTAANEKYGIAADAEKLSANAVSRGGQSQQFGLPSALMMAAGAGVGAAAGGGSGAGVGAGATTAALIGSALLKSRGPAIGARLGRVGADVAGDVANMSRNPVTAGKAGALLSDYLSEGKIGTPEAKSEAARRVGDTSGNKDEVAKKYFLGDGGF